MKKKNFPKNNISFKKVNKKSKDLTPLGSFWTAFNYGNSLLIKYSPCFLKAFIRIVVALFYHTLLTEYLYSEPIGGGLENKQKK